MWVGDTRQEVASVRENVPMKTNLKLDSRGGSVLPPHEEKGKM